MNNPDVTDLEQLKSRVTALEARNKRVEMDKAWESSWMRKLTIMTVTYAIVVIFLFVIGSDHPFINALVPPTGFFLSTLVVGDLKKIWIRGKIR